MKISVKIFLLLFLAAWLSSCHKANRFDCLKSTGQLTRIERSVHGFHSIHLEDDIDLYIHRDSICSIEIEGGKNLVDLVITTIEDSMLYISNSNKCNWVRSYQKRLKVYVGLPGLNQIWFGGSGEIVTIDTIKSNSLVVNLWGAGGNVHLLLDVHLAHLNIHTTTGDIYAKGRCGVGYYYSSSNGFIYSDNLETNLVYLLNNGTGDMYVHPMVTLEVEINGQGDVYYKGDPVNKKEELNGQGKLIKL